MALVAWRVLLAALLFRLFFPRVRRGFTGAAWGLGSMLVAYYLAAVFAFQHAPVGEVSLCIGCAPLFVLLYQALGGRFPLLGELTAVTLTLTGLGVMLWPSMTDGSQTGVWVGLLSALVAAALTAGYATAHRALALRARSPSGAEVGRAAFLPLGLILLLGAGFAGGGAVMPRQTLAVLAVLGLGVVSTALPTLAVAVASSRLPAFLNTLIRLTTPVFATGFGWVFLHQQLTLWTLGGGALILCGLVVQGLGGGGRTI
ncbi:hypothetical protein BW247_00450 [Acidihalobacter ferrooxydans]|uniref:EamA domain-containing protein n=2 Tax=Acidihalobacter ferrooxydans TaxID=1765967 RepID=A0A1P8UD81_9GAMM|nr:hypothetical protein BW247_00450 [Acidihalobacter ferrooxydans]